ncbi:MAG TPA: bifunctional [glutamate--ammonia ligase]-adenylyl-L-tyrosine phosphorylase/[glutamate--ammonia-ligase] adenylyltransferase [Gammaproteobacteria bacterium]|nr:bifunctional [glutamate--ammonia ligase]-adenylyl-L-tyrosine phosphorylase/[glutamate--ammonia-ligase] adenylyltransferase [Gammaproteobacteria bacterium]
MVPSPDPPQNPNPAPGAPTASAAPRLADLLGGPAGAQLASALVTDEQRRRAWLAVVGASRFVFRELRRYPELVRELLEDPGLLAPDRTPDDLRAGIADAVAGAAEREAFLAALRRARHWCMVRIAFRELAGWSDFATTSAELTAVAEACIEAALGQAEAAQRERFGSPRLTDGGAATLTVLGMGKLGGAELNFSSDIDLVFVFTGDGQTDGARPLDNAGFFTRVGRQAIQALSEATADGFAFRVDMRLRPHGDGGPLVPPVDALEQYYQVHGREWERYALVKARPVAGDRAQGERLLADLQPFIFRRFLDFGAVEAVRDLKVQIQRQVESRRHRDDIKLGRGGIREIEFIVQAFQLLYGGRQAELRQRPTLTILDRLQALELLPDRDVAHLRAAYLFLRELENRLQMLDDKQTHRLPDDPEDLTAVAANLGFADSGAFLEQLEAHRDRVQEAFDQTFAAPQTDQGEGEGEAPLVQVWRGALEDDRAGAVLGEHGYLEPGRAVETLTQLRRAKFRERLTATGRDRLDRLMPLVIGAAGSTPRPATALARMVEVLEAIGGRTTYFALLAENPVALAQVVQLCGGSSFLAHFLGRHPMLMDEILDPEELYACRIRASRRATLEQELTTAADLEDRLNALRRFKSIEVLHLAARDLQGHADLEEVSHGLTEVAELALDKGLELAWDELTERYGVPECSDEDGRRPAGFGIVGFGKLGGAELGYGSDLDLVFLHDSRGADQHTSGGSQGQTMDNGRFFARLGQRLIHFVTTLTAEGALYSIDMRLRPGGKSGALVASLDHFRDYQQGQAWVWEHQALLRGRPVAGSAPVGAAFDRIRGEVLAAPRDSEALAEAVRDMRGRMLAEHASGAGVFNLKRDRGGLVDIEFLIQFLCLRHAHDHSGILATSNRAALAALAEHGLLDPERARALDDAYALFRTLENRIKLFEDRAQAEITGDPTWREQLDRMAEPEWRPVVERITACREQVRAAFDELLGPPERDS